MHKSVYIRNLLPYQQRISPWSKILYYKTAVRVCGSVRAFDSFACIGAGTAGVGNSKTCAFDAILI